MRKSTSINLELIKGEDGGVKFYAKQFDDLKLKIKVYDGLEEVNVDGQDIIVCIIKEDKTVIEQTKDITVEDNTIVARLSKQATTALGKCSMEVLLRDEEGTASTTTISYLVSEKLSASIVEMIKSEDDINALNLIEEFIETSNVDMLDIKEAIKDLNDSIDRVQGNIDAEYETIIEALRTLEGTIIENIEGKTTEAITKADEAVEKATGAVTKADEVLIKVEEAKGVVGEITTLKNEAVGAIGSIKTEAIDEINNIKTRAIGDIDEAKGDALEAIRNNGNGVVQGLNTYMDTLKQDLANNGLLETNKVISAREESITKINELKENVLGSLGEEALEVEEELNNTVTEIKEQAKTDLSNSSRVIVEGANREIEGIKTEVVSNLNSLKSGIIEGFEEELNEKKVQALNGFDTTLSSKKDEIISELENNKNSLVSGASESITEIKTNTISSLQEELNECKSNLDTYIEEVKGQCRTDLNEIKNEVVSKVNSLKETVDNTLASITEKINESDSNIEELTELIKEAREVAGLVRAFIDSKTVDLSNYYTKEETDEKLKKINEFRGMIGESDLPSVFETCPEPETKYDAYICSYDVYYHRYVKIYFHDLEGANELNVLRLSSNLYTINTNSYNTTVYVKTATEDWAVSAKNGINYKTKDIKIVRNLVYKNTLRIAGVQDNILEAKAEEGSILGSYNSTVIEGVYKVSHSSKIEGSPKNAVEGVLKVNKADNVISQVLIDEKGVSYTRYCKDNNWTKWNGGDEIGEISYVVKTEFDKINEYHSYWKLRPAQPADYPYRLMVLGGTKYGIIIYSKTDLTGRIVYNQKGYLEMPAGYEDLELLAYRVLDITGNSSSEMFWMKNTNPIAYVNSSSNVVGAWYSHNFDILDTEGNIYRKSEEFDTSKVITDFNNAIENTIYKVNIKAGDVIASSPFSVNADEGIALIPELDTYFEGAILSTQDIKGILEVVKAKEIVKQELTTTDNISYKRMFNGTSWSDWKKEITGDDLITMFRELNKVATLD